MAQFKHSLFVWTKYDEQRSYLIDQHKGDQILSFLHRKYESHDQPPVQIKPVAMSRKALGADLKTNLLVFHTDAVLYIFTRSQ